MGAVEGTVPAMGGGGDVTPGEMLFGGGPQGETGKETEWEVDHHLLTSRAPQHADGTKVYVIDDKKTKNAFVLPGGKIFVFTGILSVSANDDGLATVLGHEIAHQGELAFTRVTVSFR